MKRNFSKKSSLLIKQIISFVVVHLTKYPTIKEMLKTLVLGCTKLINGITFLFKQNKKQRYLTEVKVVYRQNDPPELL